MLALQLGEFHDGVFGYEDVPVHDDAAQAAVAADVIKSAPSNVKALCRHHHRDKCSLFCGGFTKLLEQVPGFRKLGLLALWQGFHEGKLGYRRFKHRPSIAENCVAVNTFLKKETRTRRGGGLAFRRHPPPPPPARPDGEGTGGFEGGVSAAANVKREFAGPPAR